MADTFHSLKRDEKEDTILEAKFDGLALVTCALILAFICWGGVYFHASVIANVFNINDAAMPSPTSDALSAIFSVFLIFIFMYGILVSLEVVLNGRRTLTRDDQNAVKMSEMPGPKCLMTWALVLAVTCLVGLYYHAGIFVDIFKRTMEVLPVGHMLYATFHILFMSLWLCLGIGSVVIMTILRRKIVSEDTEETTPFL